MRKTVIDPSYGQSMEELKGSGVSEPVFSAGVIVDSGELRLVYLSGRVATDDAAPTAEGRQRVVGTGDVKEQTRQIIRNLRSTLRQAGGDLDDIVRVRVYVVAPMTRAAFGQIHEARAEFFRKEHYPASTLVVVSGLVRADALIEMDADAVIGRSDDR
jgi:enamine deaminase RidA (YjgF/YER057c/UK114 family)